MLLPQIHYRHLQQNLPIRHSCINVLDQHLHTLVHAKLAAVDDELVVTGIAPFAVAVDVVIHLTCSVLLLHQICRLAF